MERKHDILIKPIFTEKEVTLKDEENKVTIKVAKWANKIEIKKAVEELFKVHVEKVNTINTPGKKKRVGRHEGFRPGWKKAIVKLRKGDKIDFMEAAF
jgi:large subunit ribosomal protein L23